MSVNIDLSSFRKELIWGFTQGNPMHHSESKDDLFSLVQPLTGANGTVTIGASFHPYQIIDKSGNDIWEIVYSVIKANNYCNFSELVKEKFFFHMTPPGQQAFPITLWDDERLSNEVNSEFGTYVPFLIPYLTYDDGKEPLWLKKLNGEVAETGNAENFIASVNQTSRTLMPEPTFIVGFGEFDKNNPTTLINHYVDFLEKHIRKE